MHLNVLRKIPRSFVGCFCSAMISCVFFQVHANITLIEQIRGQNDTQQEQVVERTYYDYDVQQVTFTYPDEEVNIDVWGRIDPRTITSIDMSNRAIWLCSSIARQNLHRLTRLPYYSGFSKDNTTISQQDAVWLIQQGESYLVPTPLDELVESLNKMYMQHKVSIIDLYLYKPSGIGSEDVFLRAYEDPVYQTYIQQGHRVVVFLGTDNQRYVLDPLRGAQGTQAQGLMSYATAKEFVDRIWYIPKYGYTPYRDSDYQGVSFAVDTHVKKYIARIHENDTPMHYFPSDRSEILTLLERGTAGEIQEKSGERYNLSYAGIEGRVHATQLTVETYSFSKKPEDLLVDQWEMYLLYLRFLYTKI